MRKKKNKNFKTILKAKIIPLWLIVILLIESSMAVGILEYYVMKKQFNNTLLSLTKTTKNPEELMLSLKQKVIPVEGYGLSVRWKDIGEKLLEAGIIDNSKYESLFANDSDSLSYLKYLKKSSNMNMRINEKNSRFMVNTLWALGLVNKNPILTEGDMKTYGNGDHMSYASTGGWNLGTKPTSELYAAEELIKLSPQQQELVKKIASSVYRPCCGNSTAFPDCNHGMAALGYIELAVSQGVPEDKIYKDLLYLNSFWFPQQYVQLAAYMNKNGVDWKNVDAKKALSNQYSSSVGAQQIQQAVQNLPGFESKQGGCSA